MLIRRLARPMMASMFIYGGIAALRSPAGHAKMAEDVAPRIAEPLGLPTDTETLVKINGAVQVGAGSLLALGRFPRLASLALAGSLVPTTLAGHRFWEQKDPQQRMMQQQHFLKNMSMLGGLLLAAVDTEGKPSLLWRAGHAGDTARLGATAAAAGARTGVKAGRASAKTGAQLGRTGTQLSRAAAKAAAKADRAGAAASKLRAKADKVESAANRLNAQASQIGAQAATKASKTAAQVGSTVGTMAGSAAERLREALPV